MFEDTSSAAEGAGVVAGVAVVALLMHRFVNPHIARWITDRVAKSEAKSKTA